MLKSTSKQKISIYDLLHLSSLVVVPFIFIFVDPVSNFIERELNVSYPFVVLFSILFLNVFFFLHRIAVKIHELEFKIRVIIQEIAQLSDK